MAKEEAKKKTNTKTNTVKKSNASRSSTKKSAGVKKTVNKKANATPVNKEVKKEVSKTPAIVQEENHFGRTILAAALILVIFVGGYFGIKYKVSGNAEAKYEATEDEDRFKKEYEEINGELRSNGQKNRDVSIPKDNNMVYIDIDKAAEILESGSGVIYFGFASCPWCRNLAPVLINAMSSTSLDTIYYVDVRALDKAENDIRDTFILDDKGRARKGKDAASDSYYDVLLYLASYLQDYELTTDKGKKVSTGEKRLMAPTVVAVKDGVVVGFHEGTVENHVKDESGALRDLTKEEEDSLYNILTGMIGKYLDSGCREDGC